MMDKLCFTFRHTSFSTNCELILQDCFPEVGLTDQRSFKALRSYCQNVLQKCCTELHIHQQTPSQPPLPQRDHRPLHLSRLHLNLFRVSYFLWDGGKSEQVGGVSHSSTLELPFIKVLFCVVTSPGNGFIQHFPVLLYEVTEFLCFLISLILWICWLVENQRSTQLVQRKQCMFQVKFPLCKAGRMQLGSLCLYCEWFCAQL